MNEVGSTPLLSQQGYLRGRSPNRRGGSYSVRDGVENIFEVFKDMFVLKPDNAYVKSSQEVRPYLISLRSCVSHVRVTIQFDSEPTFRTIKVDVR